VHGTAEVGPLFTHAFQSIRRDVSFVFQSNHVGTRHKLIISKSNYIFHFGEIFQLSRSRLHTKVHRFDAANSGRKKIIATNYVDN
jgi:hypothetical protein